MSRQFTSLDKPGTSTMDARRAGRATERVVAASAIILAAIFVLLAIIALVFAGSSGLGPWLPLHLLLAGAATTAIAGVMPFFSAALTNAPPAPGWLRLLAVAAVAVGTLLVIGGRIASPGLVGGNAWLAGAGGVVFVVGLALVGSATLLPLHLSFSGRRTVVALTYGAALVNVVVGAALSSLLLLGWLPALEHWAALKPAHAWLNVFGFVSLVIAGTLVHLLPTVVGTRIPDSKSGLLSAAALALGAPLVALGFSLEMTVVAIVGAMVVVLGAVALVFYAWRTFRLRFAWTTDHAWHRFASGSLVAAVGWFLVACISALAMIWSEGATPLGWQLGPLMAPLFIGWVGQVLIGAWSHLVPAVGPGLPPRHARQRHILGRLATPRLVALNSGVFLMFVAGLAGAPLLFAAGMAAVLAAAAVAVALLAAAVVTSPIE